MATVSIIGLFKIMIDYMISPKAIKAVLVLLVVILAAHRTINPFEEDQKIFFAAANIAHQSDQFFPLNIYESFELKPFVAKLNYYIVYKITNILVDFDAKSEWVFCAQMLFVALIFACTAIFAKSVAQHFKIDGFYIFIVTAIALLTVGSESFMQVEHFAVVLTLLAIGLAGAASRPAAWMSIIVLGYVAGLKGVTAMYSLAALCFIVFYIMRRQHKSGYFFASLLIIITAILIDLNSLTQASVMQGLGLNIGGMVKKTIPSAFTFVDLPFLFVLFSLPLMVFWIKMRPPNGALFGMAAIFCILLPSVVLQVGFTYHYFGYLFFLLLMLPFFVATLTYKQFALFKRNILYSLPIIIPLAGYLVFSADILRPLKRYQDDLYIPQSIYGLKGRNKDNWDEEKRVMSDVSARVNNVEPMLYLTDGVANFWLSNPSFCREFFPLSVNRLHPLDDNNTRKLNNSRYKETMACINAYEGQYILIQTSWLPFELYNEIYPDSRYSLIFKDETPERKYSLYKKI